MLVAFDRTAESHTHPGGTMKDTEQHESNQRQKHFCTESMHSAGFSNPCKVVFYLNICTYVICTCLPWGQIQSVPSWRDRSKQVFAFFWWQQQLQQQQRHCWRTAANWKNQATTCRRSIRMKTKWVSEHFHFSFRPRKMMDFENLFCRRMPY